MTARKGPFVVSAVLGGLFLAQASAQERASVPSFPAQADVITVDALVLDDDGRPIRGLTRGDFTIREDGTPQEIVAFEARDLAAVTRAPAPPTGMPGAAEGKDEEPTPGRVVAFIFDDTGLDARCMAAVDAIRKWLRESADPRDDLALVTTSGDVDVSGSVGASRGTFLRSLERVRCRRPGPAFFTPPSSDSPLSEWQAYEMLRKGTPNAIAQMIVGWWRDRARRIVAAIEAFSGEHAEERGRKSAFVFTQGFIRDDDLKQAEEAIDAAHRANTAVYFVDPRGLVAGSLPGMPRDGFPDSALEAAHQIDLAGAEQIAQETGGRTLRSNDTLGDLRTAVDESSAYYLLGYVPSRGPDGRWRKLRVEVSRNGAKVRARRGYFASVEPFSAAAATRGDSQGVPVRTTGTDQYAPGEPLPAPRTDTASDRAGRSPAAATTPAGTEPALRFAARAEAITVDVVVLDKDGQPVSGLSKDEFTLLEDGRRQPIVGFEPRELLSELPEEDEEEAKAPIASNERPAAGRGRTLAFLIDDLGIQPATMTDAARALSKWLAEGADPRDEVTLATSSGEAWWSDTVREGRGDLEAVLARVKGRRDAAGAREAMSDFEAYSIDTFGSPIENSSAPPSSAPSLGGSPCASSSSARTMLDRVTDRWFTDRSCFCVPEDVPGSIRECRGRALMRAREVYERARRRTAGLLANVERLSRGLASSKGRKTIVILSEGFLQDVDQDAFRRAVDASRRGNTSVSFVDVRGLVGLPAFSAEQVTAPAPGDLGMAGAISRADAAGAETLADRTGGSVAHDTNDLAGAVERLADESSAYYLLGYQTDRPFDGRWRKLQVKVTRPGLSVRARRGYYAMAEPPPLAIPAKDKKAAKQDRKAVKDGAKKESLPVRALDPALAVGGQRDEIPIRLAPHVFETDSAGEVRALVALEVDTAALGFTAADAGGERKAKLDVTVLGVSRDHPVAVPLDSAVELSLAQDAPGGWWIFSRELKLPPGPAQVRAFVRDTATGHAGLVAQRLEVPGPAAPYLSTPILTDLQSRNDSPGARIVPVAHRSFSPRGNLFCAYEVYLAPGRDLTTVPDVRSSYTLTDEGGRIVSEEPPTPVAVALGGGVARTHVLPLAQLAPGRYQLAIQATDPKLGVDLRWSGAFVVAAGSAAATADDRTERLQ